MSHALFRILMGNSLRHLKCIGLLIPGNVIVGTGEQEAADEDHHARTEKQTEPQAKAEANPLNSWLYAVVYKLHFT